MGLIKKFILTIGFLGGYQRVQAQTALELDSSYSFAHRWFQSITETECTQVNKALFAKALSAIKDYFVHTKENLSEKKFFDEFLIKSVSCSRPLSELERIARTFIEIKKELLECDECPSRLGSQREFNKRVFLLQLLAEETLYTVSMQKRVVFSVNLETVKYENRNEISLNGFKIQDGDILLSKGDAGSSAFISRIGEWPSFYSHTTVASFEPLDRMFYSPEAFAEDSVKKRSLHEAHIPLNGLAASGKRRLSVFRLSSKYQNQYFDWTKKVLDFTRQLEQSPVPYDFFGDLDDPSSMICFEVCDQQARLTKLPRPYAEAHWSTLSPKQRSFFKAMGQITEKKFPVPSNIEKAHEAWEWVAFQIDLGRLFNDRVDSVMLDTFWAKMIEPKYSERFEAVFKKLEKLPENSPQEMAFRLKAKQQGIQLIDGLGWRQTLFFGLLEKKVAPQLQRWGEESERRFQKTSPQNRPRSLQEIRVQMDQVFDPYVEKFLVFFEN